MCRRLRPTHIAGPDSNAATVLDPVMHVSPDTVYITRGVNSATSVSEKLQHYKHKKEERGRDKEGEAHQGRSFGEGRNGTRSPTNEAKDPASARDFSTSSLHIFHHVLSFIAASL